MIARSRSAAVPIDPPADRAVWRPSLNGDRTRAGATDDVVVRDDDAVPVDHDARASPSLPSNSVRLDVDDSGQDARDESATRRLPNRRRSTVTVAVTTPPGVVGRRRSAPPSCHRRRPQPTGGERGADDECGVSHGSRWTQQQREHAGGEREQRRSAEQQRRCLPPLRLPRRAATRGPRRRRSARSRPGVSNASPPVACAICRERLRVRRDGPARSRREPRRSRPRCRARPCRSVSRRTWRAPHPRSGCEDALAFERRRERRRIADSGRSGSERRRADGPGRRRRSATRAARARPTRASASPIAVPLPVRAVAQRVEHQLAIVRQRRRDERLARERDEPDAVLRRELRRGSAGSPPGPPRAASASRRRRASSPETSTVSATEACSLATDIGICGPRHRGQCSRQRQRGERGRHEAAPARRRRTTVASTSRFVKGTAYRARRR